jgi:hypothetical protein
MHRRAERQRLDYVRFRAEQLVRTSTDHFLGKVETREPEEEPVVARFRARKLAVCLPELGIFDPICHHLEPLAATGLHDARHEKPVEKELVSAAPRVPPEGVHVGVLLVSDQPEPSLFHDSIHDVEMFELLAGKRDEWVDDRRTVRVFCNERQPHGARFSLAERVIDEEGRKVGEYHVDPRGRSRNEKAQHAGGRMPNAECRIYDASGWCSTARCVRV